MIKTYIVKNGCNLITTIFVGGVERTIEFKGGATYPTYSGGSFSTSDEVLQKALEFDIGFGHSFYLLPQEIILRDVLEVSDKQTAIKWVNSEFGLQLPSGTSKLKIAAFAKSKGVMFPNLISDGENANCK